MDNKTWETLYNVLQEYMTELEQKIILDIPNEYALKNNIVFDIEIGDGYYAIEFIAPEYWKWANYGRGGTLNVKPDGKQNPKPPFSKDALNNISNWITARRITPRAKKNGKLPSHNDLTWAIATNIGKYGTDGAHFLESSLADYKEYWEEKIINAIVTDISNHLDKFLLGLY